ncbi:ABC-type nitrate/sulfonate/bicarbonate transport system, ATPase component [Desulfosporosinus orientis DSM 765]|uniref:ABC-type nitrate/sulfonate/bicarbonate transport system, ATPase component n=1 Tax=Desulfosporosinus orientis (strain ATCC 19365 / DSM 765 / NCIMB 8382 / VKM B-1628 / Singapore I) TaxID=768706 RepID=G7WB85_DESOD|nr:ABC transporter ATP-binding protein [Desulfosporosinus orientis]AET67866.1 ABC-type nitrate/sulfonate/bicarbonate transport system, ATPase component [Desulfosporosinus orientis DSM 765]
MIEVSHCDLTYKQGMSQVQVYDDFSLNIAQGESLVLIGPSGCGKSTLLYLLSGLLSPTGGEIRIWGEQFKGTRQKSAFILQEYGLFPWLNVEQNVSLGLRVRHAAKQTRQERTEELIRKMGLWEVKHHFPSQLSGGQRQRVALARALTLNPDLLLMDEPLSALDALTRERLQTLLLEIWQEQKLTTVLVTHSIEEAVFLGSRILVLLDGRPTKIVGEILNPLVGTPGYRQSSEFFEKTSYVRSLLERGGQDEGK